MKLAIEYALMIYGIAFVFSMLVALLIKVLFKTVRAFNKTK